jgi:hypothetical protein
MPAAGQREQRARGDRPGAPQPRVHGSLAWLAWLALHILTLLGGRNRISALVNMSWRYLTWRYGGGLIAGDGMPGLVPLSRPEDPAMGQVRRPRPHS